MDTKLNLQKLINVNLDFVISEILPLIDNEFARVSATEVVHRLKATVVALTDDVEPNKEQLALIWGTLTSDPKITEAVRAALLKAVTKIDEPALKQGLSLLVEPVVKTMVAVSDNTKTDGEQIKRIWKDFLNSPEFVAFLLTNLSWIIDKVIKNEDVKKWILEIIKLFTK